MAVIISSMIADQIDVDETNHHIRREGLFVSLQSWIISMSSVIAVISSGIALNAIGFEALNGPEQSHFSILAMRIFLVVGTVVSAGIGYWLIKKYNYSEHSQTL
ncbi:MFS transporter [Psychrosphaera algicola]|uniref:MFS transporter n=1 Tax=Psychrosphaera algicola TaxID=3023714 RepID=A0ABT5FJ27_9GAMM|nr:MFS transporter [Psychrosphaera sp. G1-22]MDC2891200.1 MFS transporter [Psychrosphaera sp. G1-22]